MDIVFNLYMQILKKQINLLERIEDLLESMCVSE